MLLTCPKPLLIALLGILLLYTTVAEGQIRKRFQSLTVDDGLAQNSVQAILQDYKGYLWIGTADGLNRYDGYRFVQYKPVDGDSTSLIGTSIYSLHEDSRKNLWISSDKGVSVYVRPLDSFKNFEMPTGMILAEDQKGRVWASNQDSQFIAFESLDQTIAKVTYIEEPLGVSLRPAARLGAGIYMGSRNGIIKIDTESDTVLLLHRSPEGNGVHFLEKDGKIHGLYGVTRYELAGDSFRKFPTKDFNVQSLNFNSFLIDWNSRILAGNSSGLYVFDYPGWNVLQKISSFDVNNQNLFPYVQSLHSDAGNNVLYVGTNGNGLKIYSPYQNRFDHYTTGNAHTDFIKDIDLTPDGKVITGLYAEGIVIYENQDTFTHIPLGSEGQIESALAVSVYDQDMLLVINNGHLLVLNYKTKAIEYREKLDEYIAYPAIQQMDAGDWLINSNSQVYRLSRDLSKTAMLKTVIDAPKEKISCYGWLSGKGMLVGTTLNLFFYGPDGKYKATWVKDVFIKSIHQDSQGRIWVATTRGLFEMDTDGALLRKHDRTTGLPDDFIYGVLEDDLGYLWLSHNKGLTRLHPETGEYLHFDVNDGLQSNEFNTGAFYKDKKGLLYFGGVNGVNIIDPANLLMNTHPPKIALNQINLFDEPLLTDTSYNELNHLVLPYSQNTLSFDFSALDYSQPGSNLYAYQMAGYDQNWIESGDRHYARYANLPPGTYTFQMKAANGDGVWTESPKVLRITIIPPFWKRVWFILIIILGVLLLLIASIRWFLRIQNRRLRQEMEVQHRLELERLRISRDLHDNVGAQLSYLITNMEWMANHPDKLDPGEQIHQLRQLSDTGKQAITTLRQTIWAISQNELSVEEFADRFKQFALKMVEFRPEIQTHFNEQIEDNGSLSPSVALNLFRICQEAFHNALKHSAANNLHIRFLSSSIQPFEFELKDDGVGFSHPAGSDGFGMANMKARAAESQATLKVISEPGKGTQIILSWSGVLSTASAVLDAVGKK